MYQTQLTVNSFCLDFFMRSFMATVFSRMTTCGCAETCWFDKKNFWYSAETQHSMIVCCEWRWGLDLISADSVTWIKAFKVKA